MRLPTRLASWGTGRVAALCVGAAILAIFAVIGIWLAQERRQILDERGHRTGSNLAHVLKTQVAGSLQAIDLTLLHVADALKYRPGLAKHDPEFEELMRQKLPRLTFVRALFVIGPDGFITQDTDHPFTPPANLADRDYFRIHAENPSAGLHIGRPLLSRSVGTWFVSVSRRVDRPDGSFGGVVVAAVEVERFAAFYRALELDPRDSIVLFLRDGTVLLWSPEMASVMSRSFPGLPLFREHILQRAHGSFRSTSTFDGRPRIVSYYALKEYPMIVAVTLAEDALLAPWRRNAIIVGSAGLVFAAVLALLAHSFVGYRQRIARVRERQLHAQRLETLGRMTGGIAHDVNNLLAVIGSGVRLLRRGDHSSGEVLARIAEAVAQGHALMSQLLSFAKRQALDIRSVDVNERIERLQQLMRQAAGYKVSLDLDLAKDLWPSRLDPTQFDAALLNLVVNARDAMPEGGRLKISTRNLVLKGHAAGYSVPAGAYVEVCLRDTGNGMPPETVRRAVEPFFSTKGESGTGLGLSQVYGFVQQVKGDLRIESGVGRGTAVHMLFQRAPDLAGGAAPPSSPPDAPEPGLRDRSEAPPERVSGLAS